MSRGGDHDALLRAHPGAAERLDLDADSRWAGRLGSPVHRPLRRGAAVAQPDPRALAPAPPQLRRRDGREVRRELRSRLAPLPAAAVPPGDPWLLANRVRPSPAAAQR